VFVPVVVGDERAIRVRAEARMERRVLSYEDGRIIGDTALDAISEVTERWTEASLILVRVELVIEVGGQLHEVVRIARGASDQPSGSGET
jgi:hypothetical protein